MYKRTLLGQGSIWVNTETKVSYVILGIANCDDAGKELEGKQSAIYHELGRLRLHYMNIEEFLDGKFDPIG